jgi:hypothetical protein
MWHSADDPRLEYFHIFVRDVPDRVVEEWIDIEAAV